MTLRMYIYSKRKLPSISESTTSEAKNEGSLEDFYVTTFYVTQISKFYRNKEFMRHKHAKHALMH